MTDVAEEGQSCWQRLAGDRYDVPRFLANPC